MKEKTKLIIATRIKIFDPNLFGMKTSVTAAYYTYSFNRNQEISERNIRNFSAD
ncbi:hypothetical protein LEP1GSC058_1817 [Leptospira fainei serovar Hurstbridge str. BUT 6]|uniref:Uncharacterized protein n=1 Tax=Leptospira fainei serovar Hurstbridge str. BUT 6 TaxID=1193011 RepID=S3UWC6_9LEPT|nr:hypothetical protein LEP1GSC058_1817 [Leptospira fainei serovar Hurstbridge str. BUT 6]